MATISSTTAKAILKALGWRTDTDARYKQALRDFQGGWNLGASLEVDGLLGPATSAALTSSNNRRKSGLSTASSHFSFNEFACKCGGKYAACRRINGEGSKGSDRHVLRNLVAGLEILRSNYYRNGMSLVSGYRCDGHNQAVGGASSSQHRWGAAVDISPVASTSQVKALKRFSGIGYQGSTGKVRHVDVRSVSGHNSTGASVASPTTWRY
jgi:hypothetical protein